VLVGIPSGVGPHPVAFPFLTPINKRGAEKQQETEPPAALPAPGAQLRTSDDSYRPDG
jgi:hypothetical protein